MVAGRGGRGALYARSDTANAHEIKADLFKIKYLTPPFPNHDRRDNEVFTEVAAARFLWALGFPADHMYSAHGGQVHRVQRRSVQGRPR